MIKCENLQKTYQLKRLHGFQALIGLDLSIKAGEFVAVTGPSGCGKSTLLNILGFLDKPSAGHYFFRDRNVGSFSDSERSALRLSEVGFIFQSFNLLPRFTALDNVRLPMLYLGAASDESETRARALLERVGLKDKAEHSPLELSGGERQRVGMARALANNPGLLLADEPTGNLDSRTGLEVMALLKELNASGLTIIMVTHDQGLAKQASRIISMKDGAIENP
ncbi:MAG TPA: ABC transporter ATP-binding protein [Elusimicrobiales bacterium]|nr:ABC transporter ATP-binding protein [Elusimicrobiales bacterium]